MSNFDFRTSIREGLYNLKYSGDDKVRVVLNEGKTLLVEREIHEGIMDLLKGFTRTQPGWEKELERQIDAWLEKSELEDARKLALKRFYMRNLENLPPSFYEDEENLEQVEDSLNAAEEGDVDKAEQELEDAVESAEDEEAEPEKGESLKAQKGDLVVVTSGDNQFLLRIGDIVGGEEEGEPESRRGSLGQRARGRAMSRRRGSMGLVSGYTGSLREGILRLNEQEYMIDAGMLLNTGTKYLPKKAVDLTVDIARIATDEDIAKVKEQFPEQFERLFVSQEEPTAAEEAGDEATTLVDNNVDLIVRFLRKPDRDVSGKLKMLFKPFFEKAGIPWKGGSAVDPIMDLMRQVAVNRKIRNKMTSMVNEQDESRKFAKKVLAETVRAYTKKNGNKK